MPINSPVRCSKSNGRIENAVKRFQGQLRVLKLFFESQAKREIGSDSAILTWLIVWSAECLNKFRVGDDGKSAYERITKHACKH